jgi:hypothetical protein
VTPQISTIAILSIEEMENSSSLSMRERRMLSKL